MKAGPVLAMVGLLLVGMWLVLQPTLTRDRGDLTVRVGASELVVERVPEQDGGLRFVAPERLAERGVLDPIAFERVLEDEIQRWEGRPSFERTLLGFFNITSWVNFTWVAVGLAGQIAFFGRMMVQWIVSEKSRKSTVPELFWWLSFLGGVCLFTYFVWRVDVVGVLGQSTGVVVYARNLRLIRKQRRREARAAAQAITAPASGGDTEPEQNSPR
ncbi:MAG: lipid-A-disaccharide synthase N-terminal domain-containing protein [Planctomycetota bacterium]